MPYKLAPFKHSLIKVKEGKNKPPRNISLYQPTQTLIIELDNVRLNPLKSILKKIRPNRFIKKLMIIDNDRSNPLENEVYANKFWRAAIKLLPLYLRSMEVQSQAILDYDDKVIFYNVRSILFALSYAPASLNSFKFNIRYPDPDVAKAFEIFAHRTKLQRFAFPSYTWEKLIPFQKSITELHCKEIALSYKLRNFFFPAESAPSPQEDYNILSKLTYLDLSSLITVDYSRAGLKNINSYNSIKIVSLLLYIFLQLDPSEVTELSSFKLLSIKGELPKTQKYESLLLERLKQLGPEQKIKFCSYPEMSVSDLIAIIEGKKPVPSLQETINRVKILAQSFKKFSDPASALEELPKINMLTKASLWDRNELGTSIQSLFSTPSIFNKIHARRTFLERRRDILPLFTQANPDWRFWMLCNFMGQDLFQLEDPKWQVYLTKQIFSLTALWAALLGVMEMAYTLVLSIVDLDAAAPLLLGLIDHLLPLVFIIILACKLIGKDLLSENVSPREMNFQYYTALSLTFPTLILMVSNLSLLGFSWTILLGITTIVIPQVISFFIFTSASVFTNTVDRKFQRLQQLFFYGAAFLFIIWGVGTGTASPL